MLAFCCGDPTLRTSHIEPRLNIDSTTLWCWCGWGFQMCLELSSHLKDFWIKSIDYPFHTGLEFGGQFTYIYILAFCCGDRTLRTSRIELRLNIDSTTLWCWCGWGFQMCLELISHLKDLWIKSVDYPFHMGFKIWLPAIQKYIQI